MLRQIPAIALYAGKQSLPGPWVMILDLEADLMADSSFEGGFGNHVRLESPLSIADGDEVSCCL
jgi:hypothetical protein